MSAERVWMRGDAWAESERELGHAIRARIAPGAQTVIVTWPPPAEGMIHALASVSRGLERHGIPAGRQLLLVPHFYDPPEPFAELAARLGAQLGIPALAHDKDRSPCFVFDRSEDGPDLEINDELREAEAVIFVGPRFESDPDGRGLMVALTAGTSSRRFSEEAIARSGSSDWGVRAMSPEVLVEWGTAEELKALGL